MSRTPATQDPDRGLSEDAPSIIENLARHLREHGGSYFDPPSPQAVPDVRLIEGDRRSVAQLYWFELTESERALPVVVKVSGAVEAPTMRPRMASPPDARTKYLDEHRALSTIYAHFADRDPDRFGAIRVIDLLPDHRAFVMEAVDLPTLRQLVIGRSREAGARGMADLTTAFRNAGAWLHEYHGLRATEDRDEVLVDRDEFLDFVGRITGFLAERSGGGAYFSRVRDQISADGRACLPDRMPAGLSHNDYCMRNILVGPSQDVTVIDTVGRYCTPIYRDVSFFLTDLTYSVGPALLSGGFRYPLRMQDYRAAFLDGYFAGSEIPDRMIRVFEVQALLERWCSAVSRAALTGRPRDRLRSHVVSALFRVLIQRRLRGTRGGSAVG